MPLETLLCLILMAVGIEHNPAAEPVNNVGATQDRVRIMPHAGIIQLNSTYG